MTYYDPIRGQAVRYGKTIVAESRVARCEKVALGTE